MAWMIVGYVKTYLDKCKRDNIGAFAAQAAFFIIMSAIPFFMVFMSLLRYIPISRDYVMELMYAAMPGYIQPFLRYILTEVYSRSFGVLSLAVIVALWSAGKALQYMTAGLNVLNGIEETRNWLVVRFWSVMYTVILIFALLLVLILMVFNEHIQGIMQSAYGLRGLLFAIISVRPLIRGLLVFGVLTGLFVWFFTVLPNKKVKPVSQLPGAVICGAIWYVFSMFLSLYVKIYDRFSIYGSLSTLVLMMFWLYSCMYIMFMCAEANVFFGQVFGGWMSRKKEALQARLRERRKKS